MILPSEALVKSGWKAEREANGPFLFADFPLLWEQRNEEEEPNRPDRRSKAACP